MSMSYGQNYKRKLRILHRTGKPHIFKMSGTWSCYYVRLRPRLNGKLGPISLGELIRDEAARKYCMLMNQFN